jgi:hypothetical protein
MYGKSASLIKYVLVVTALLYAGLGNAALVTLDKQLEDSVDGLVHFDVSNLIQTFEQSQDNIAGAGLFLNANSLGSGMVTISLFDSFPTTPSDAIVSRSASGDDALGSDGWVDVYWDPILVNSTDTLYLLFTSTVSGFIAGGATTDSGPGCTANSAGTCSRDTYTLGYASINGQAQNGEFQNGDPVPHRDFTFRTYYDNGVSAVPVPAAAWLFGTALIGFIGFSRRTKV